MRETALEAWHISWEDLFWSTRRAVMVHVDYRFLAHKHLFYTSLFHLDVFYEGLFLSYIFF